MVIQMLEAVSEMLGSPIEVVKVECARTLLNKIIEGMKPRQSFFDDMEINPVTMPSKETKRAKIPNNAPPVTIHPPSDNLYPILLNDDKTLKEIQGLPWDALVELDGVQMTHRDAVGMSFTTGKVV